LGFFFHLDFITGYQHRDSGNSFSLGEPRKPLLRQQAEELSVLTFVLGMLWRLMNA
jgi:hypothetical protein